VRRTTALCTFGLVALVTAGCGRDAAGDGSGAAMRGDLHKLCGEWRSWGNPPVRLTLKFESPDKEGEQRLAGNAEFKIAWEQNGPGQAAFVFPFTLKEGEKGKYLEMASPAKDSPLPAEIPYRFERDDLVLTFPSGPWQGEHLLERFR
jgi:hypothetical protein